MTANDLRIGNLILAKGWEEDAGGNIVGDVEGDEIITVDLIVMQCIIKNNSITQYEPIPLTKEWLVKFGFKDGKLRLGEIEIIITSTFKCISNGEDGCGINIDHVQYVHQLQNLYFALTGEELSIK